MKMRKARARGALAGAVRRRRRPEKKSFFSLVSPCSTLLFDEKKTSLSTLPLCPSTSSTNQPWLPPLLSTSRISSAWPPTSPPSSRRSPLTSRRSLRSSRRHWRRRSPARQRPRFSSSPPRSWRSRSRPARAKRCAAPSTSAAPVAKRSAGARGKEERPIIRFLWREFNVCVLFVATLALRGCWFFFFPSAAAFASHHFFPPPLAMPSLSLQLTRHRARVTASKFDESTPVKKVRCWRSKTRGRKSERNFSRFFLSVTLLFKSSFAARRRKAFPLLTTSSLPLSSPPPRQTKKTSDPDLGQEGAGQDAVLDDPPLGANAREEVEEKKKGEARFFFVLLFFFCLLFPHHHPRPRPPPPLVFFFSPSKNKNRHFVPNS